MAKEKFVTDIWDDLVDSIQNIRTGSNMPRYLLPNMPCLFGRDMQVCDSCCVKLTLFKRKKLCSQCHKVFCIQCIVISTDKTVQCRICTVLTMQPPDKQLLLQLRVKDLQRFLTAHHVSTHGCVEKEDLVNLLLHFSNEKSHPENSSDYSPPAGSSTTPDDFVFVDTCAHFDGPDSTTGGASTSFSLPTHDSSTVETGVDVAEALGGGSRNNEFSSDRMDRENVQVEQSALNLAIPDTSASVVPETSIAVNVSSPSAPSCSTDTAENILSIEPLLFDSTDEPSTSNVVRASSRLLSTSPPGSPQLSENNSSSSSPVFARPTMASIQSEEDMEQMSVRQLKCLLARHRVDYHGCCEKAELVERATRLWKDYRATRADLDNLDLDELCKVCMDAPIECVMLECGHMATCTDCGRQLCECPICRQYVVRIVRTFRA